MGAVKLSDIESFLSEPEERELIKTHYIDENVSLCSFLVQRTVNMERCKPAFLKEYAADPEYFDRYVFPAILSKLSTPPKDEEGNVKPSRLWEMGHHLDNEFDIEYANMLDPNTVEVKKLKISKSIYRSKGAFIIKTQQLKEYVAGTWDSHPTNLYKSVKHYFKKYVECEDHFTVGQILWAFGTHIYIAFNSYPYLFYHAHMGSGKSRTLRTLMGICRRGWMVTTPSAASLFRTIHANSPTVLIDQVEKYIEKEAIDIVTTLDSGFEKGSMVPRVNTNDNNVIEYFDIFCPKALASTLGLPSALQNRCFNIPLKRTLNAAKYDFEPDPLHARELNQKMMFWGIDSGSAIYQKYRGGSLSQNYQEILDIAQNTRLRNQLLKPILVIAEQLEIHNLLGEMDLLREFVEYQNDISKAETLDDLSQRVAVTLYNLCPSNEGGKEVKISEIRSEMELTENEKKYVTNQRIGYIIKPFQLKYRTVAGHKRFFINGPTMTEILQRYNIIASETEKEEGGSSPTIASFESSSSVKSEGGN